MRLYIIIAFSFLFILLLMLIAKKKLPVKYALVWLFASLIMIIGGVFPKVFEFIRNILHFELISNVIITVFLGLLILITISLTIFISDQNKKITLLIQEVSMLKKDGE